MNEVDCEVMESGHGNCGGELGEGVEFCFLRSPGVGSQPSLQDRFHEINSDIVRGGLGPLCVGHGLGKTCEEELLVEKVEL